MKTNLLILSIVAAIAAPSISEAYNRQQAVNYAWNYVWSPNPRMRTYANDCTNFVSQCMSAGGWSEVGWPWQYQDPNKWFYAMPPAPASYTWSGARFFEDFMVRSNRGYLVSDWRQLRPGDVIVADWGSGGTAPGTADGIGDHVMIVVSTSSSDVLYAQHSPNKVRTLSSVRSEMWRSRFWYYRIRD